MASVIAGTGIGVPPNVVSNFDLARIMDTSDEWIRTRSGVVERRFVDPGSGSSDLAIEAGRMAMEDAGLEAVDAIVTATMTPDRQNPGIAGLVQVGLDLGPVPAYDLRQQCSGFLYGMDLADALIGTGRAESVLVVGAEVHAGYLPWGDTWEIVLGRTDREPTPDEYRRNTEHRAWSVLFGDGAGAMVVRKSDGPGGFVASRLHTDGSNFELIWVPGIGSVHRPYATTDQVAADQHLPVMDGRGLYRAAVRLLPELILEVLEAGGLGLSDLDLVVAHQANERIVDGVRRSLGVTAEVVPSNIDRWANTTAGTLPILFHELRAAGQVGPGMLVCFTAFGAGAHWGAMLYRVPG